MAVKSNLRLQPKPATPFPKLMQTSCRLIVLFDKKYCGTVVKASEGSDPIAEYSESWDMEQFTDFHGVVEISNK